MERGEDRRTLSKIRVCKNHRTEIIKVSTINVFVNTQNLFSAQSIGLFFDTDNNAAYNSIGDQISF